eukprot:scaffold2888_cov274-Pinguiococcus_pyrenoidosus.AAC.12
MEKTLASVVREYRSRRVNRRQNPKTAAQLGRLKLRATSRPALRAPPTFVSLAQHPTRECRNVPRAEDKGTQGRVWRARGSRKTLPHSALEHRRRSSVARSRSAAEPPVRVAGLPEVRGEDAMSLWGPNESSLLGEYPSNSTDARARKLQALWPKCAARGNVALTVAF